MKHEPLRYAHDEGHTDVCYSPDGSKFMTCGADGDIRIWSTNENEDPIHNCIGEWALCVRQKGNDLYVATGSNDIQILTFPNGERNGVLDRFVAPINHIAISTSSEHVALAGEDMEVKVVNTDPSNKEIIKFDGLMGPCLSVALCPNFKYLAASSGDGKLRIWDLANKSLLKDFDCFPKVNSFSNAKTLCRIDFEPTSGRCLAYPDKNTVVLLDTLDWSQIATLKSDEVTADYSIVQFSPCGKYLIATSLEGDFVMFNVSKELVHATSKHSKAVSICGLMWNPSGNGQIVYTDIEGQLGIMSECVSKAPDLPEDGFEENDVDFGDFEFEKDDADDNVNKDIVDDDDDDGENVISVEKLKKEVMGEFEPELASLDAASSIGTRTPRPMTPEIPLQPPFMPSSTPEHLNPRYLCWNDVGVIRCYGTTEDDDLGKSIEVEFHDSTFHSSMMLQNYQDYVMGSISKSALIVANASQIQAIPLSASGKEWLLKMEENAREEIVAITTSENLICFATGNYLVRVCSIFGTQRGVISIPGPVIAMASHQNVLMVAYHASGARKGDQCVGVKLVKFNGFSLESQEISSALGPEATLSWLGFSECGTPAMMDSLGMLCLFPKKCNAWVPFCDTSKHFKSPSDGFFVTAIFEGFQTVAGVKCKGSVYPGFTPRPTVCELPLEPPFVESATEKTQMEMNLFTWSNLEVGDVEKRIMETGLKAFALAAKNNIDQRALELMEIMENPALLNIATKYAMKLNKRLIAEKLMELAAKLVSDDASGSGGLPERSVMAPNADSMRTFSRKLSSNSMRRTPKSQTTPVEEINTPEKVQLSESVLTNTTLDQSDVMPESPAESAKNPFLKRLKKSEQSPLASPLSLTDKSAGVELKENKRTENAEKRKQPESETEKPKGKQRKLDRFMFSKHS